MSVCIYVSQRAVGITLRCRSNRALATTLIIFILIGLVLFIIIPAGVFYALEDWTFGEAIYCCFITVLTIGYADFVPGKSIAITSQSMVFKLDIGNDLRISYK